MKKNRNKKNELYFKFIRKNNKFKWGCKEFYIEYSNPYIQGFHDYINLKSINEVLYYYYTFKIFKKDINGKNILISEIETHDFPNIKFLKNIIDSFIKNDSIENYQIEKFNHLDDEYEFYSKYSQTDEVMCDDFYSLRREVKKVDKKITSDLYSLYCSITNDPCSFSKSTNGINIHHINKKELLELQKCINEFIKYSLFLHNKSLTKKDKYKIIENKIYRFEYDYTHSQNSIKKNNMYLSEIYIKNDIISSLTTVINNKEKDYSDVYLVDIKDDNLIISDVHNKKEKFSININDIVYMHNTPTKKELHFSKEEVAQNFACILNDNEKDEFINLDSNYVFNKYKEPIINRTSLYRDEHGFNLDYNDTSDKTNQFIFEIINMIKEILKEK